MLITAAGLSSILSLQSSFFCRRLGDVCRVFHGKRAQWMEVSFSLFEPEVENIGELEGTITRKMITIQNLCFCFG